MTRAANAPGTSSTTINSPFTASKLHRGRVAADRARSQMVSGSRWVSPSAREVASGSSARGEAALRSADAGSPGIVARAETVRCDRPRPTSKVARSASRRHSSLISTCWASVRVIWLGRRRSWAISHPPSSWRGPILPVISRLSTPWSQVRRGGDRTGRPAAPATAATGSRTGRRRCGGGLAPAGCACGRCRRRRGLSTITAVATDRRGSFGSGTSPTYQTATGRSESVKGSTTESR